MDLTARMSDALICCVPRRWRLRLVLFLVRMWRRNARLRLMPPLPCTRNRLAAPLLVFILGISKTPFGMTPDGLAALRLPMTSLVFPARLQQPPGDCSVHRLLLGRQHHDHLTPFELGHLLDHPVGIEIGPYTLQQLHAEFLVCHLTAAEPQRHLGLVALFEKADQIAQL